MKRVQKLNTPIHFRSFAAVGGYEESRGRLKDKFDLCDSTDLFGQKTAELAEGEMAKCALNLALQKGSLSHEDIGLITAGDLQNQCVATSLGLSSFRIPFLGIYGACSTCTEGILLMSEFLCGGYCDNAASVTSSHNSAAERQFRTPLEYGAQRAPGAQWTATAAGAFILSRGFPKEKERSAFVSEIMPGKIIDGVIKDGANMGGAMAFAAADSIISYFEESEASPSEFDYIITGDLGRVGSDILREILKENLPAAAMRHTDCGLLLYDEDIQDIHSGASGCGTSASVLAAHFLPLLEDGSIKNILILSTGALMSPSSVLQGESIKGIAPLIRIQSRETTPAKNYFKL